MKTFIAGASLGVIAAAAFALGANYSADQEVERRMAEQRVERGDLGQYTAAVVIVKPSPIPEFVAHVSDSVWPETASGE